MILDIVPSGVQGLAPDEISAMTDLLEIFSYYQPKNEEKDKYYEGKISLGSVNLGIALPKGMQGLEIGCAWGAKCVDVLAGRSMFDGFVGMNGEDVPALDELVRNNRLIFEYSKASIPPAYNNKAEIRQSEPYVVGQTTYSTFSPRAGNTRVSWLSGAATWNYYSITQYILGIRPQYDSLLIDPCVPAKWDGFKVERRWRGMNLEIEVKNPGHVCKGIEYIEVNGKRYDSATVPVADLKDGDKIVAVMGKDAKAFEWQRL